MLFFMLLLIVQIYSCSARIEDSKQTIVDILNKTHSQEKLATEYFENQGYSAVSFEDYGCSNISPNEKGCNEIAQEGGCAYTDAYYCILSCKTCCVDKAPVGLPFDTCELIKGQQDTCDFFVEQGYCLRSCNACYKLNEIYALNQLKSSIQHPNQLATWTGWNPCYWDGVICQKNRVSEINLGTQYFDYNTNNWVSKNSLINSAASTIPAQLSCLEDLKNLWIASTGFSGSLPPELSTMTALKGAAFGGKGLSGTIPPQYSTWSNFYAFKVINTKFTMHTIPTELSLWTNMSYYYIKGDNLVGTIPALLSVWTSMKSFHIDSQYLMGTIPILFSVWTNINSFHLAGDLVGKIPIQLSTWNKINIFELYNNRLTGQVPVQLSTWTNISDFQIYNNWITGQVPIELSTWTNISDFKFFGNELTGQVPFQLSTWTNINDFEISYNKFTGQVPIQLSMWTNISNFEIQHNRLTGQVPIQLSTWTNISGFDACSGYRNHLCIPHGFQGSILSTTNCPPC